MRFFSFILAAAAALPAAALSPEDAEIVSRIDAAIEQTWNDYEIEPADQVDDSVWCRRVYLDLIGRIPRIEELTAFEVDRSDDKRQRLVQTLLHDARYTAEYAEHWATYWSNLLIGRTGGSDRRDLTNRDGMLKYLRDSMARNKPYDKLVHELVTATGTTKPGTDGFNGAVNFLVGKVNDEDATLATSSTSRIFLGQQVQCTQCHDHPFNQWKQQTFWEFNSFFRQARGLRRFNGNQMDIDHAELIDQDFAGQAGDPENAVIFYARRNGRTEAAAPRFIDGREVSASGFIEDSNRREALAAFMLESEFLDRMIVNRMWSTLLGYGFTRPVDDLGPHNPPSHPRLLEQLGEDFRASGYDLKRLLTWITASRSYGLDAELSSKNEVDDPTLGETPKFSRFYLRQMSAEQLYASMLVVGGDPGTGSCEDRERQRRQWLSRFVSAFGTDEGDESTSFNGSIPQALMMFNGDLTTQALDESPRGTLASIVRSEKSTKGRVNRMFRIALSRKPTAAEMQVAAAIHRRYGEERMLSDMWWAVLNSNEFIMQH